LIPVAVVLFTAIYLVVLYLCCRPQIVLNERSYRKIHDLQDQVKRELALGRDYEDAARALQNDPKTVERVAREKLGYSKPGEEVIYFEPVLKKPGLQ
jgi:cell division protein FtsB